MAGDWREGRRNHSLGSGTCGVIDPGGGRSRPTGRPLRGAGGCAHRRMARGLCHKAAPSQRRDKLAPSRPMGSGAAVGRGSPPPPVEAGAGRGGGLCRATGPSPWRRNSPLTSSRPAPRPVWGDARPSRQGHEATYGLFVLAEGAGAGAESLPWRRVRRGAGVSRRRGPGPGERRRRPRGGLSSSSVCPMQESPGCKGVQELLPGKERGKASSKQPAKGLLTATQSSSPPQAIGKKKLKKKKKKADRDGSNTRSSGPGSSPSASEETDKHHSKSKKHQTLSAQLLEILNLRKEDPDPAQDAVKEIHIDAEINKLLSSASTTSGSTQTEQDISDQINESLRWDGILENPAAEEERLRIYKLNRRKRYGLYVQQQLPTEPCLTLRHFPLLHTKDPYANSGQTVCQEDCSSPYFQENKDEVLNAELATKMSELQSAALPHISQKVV